ncbi:MAG: septum formation initiator family protein [Rhizobacter sp.]|nr:septum formation initiator family protein [Bacteriovorax sp.]
MEFSYDRSKDSHLRKPEERTTSQAHPQQQPSQQPAGVRAGPDLNTIDPSTIANERLRKAIERNRAKQGVRTPQPAATAQQAQPQTSGPQYQEPQAAQPQAHEQASFFNQDAINAARAQHAQATQTEAPQYEEEPVQRPSARIRARERVSTPTPPPPPIGTTVVSRRSVAKPEDTEFVPATKRPARKVASQISYTTTSTRKKQKSLDPKYEGWLVKGAWIFCGIMVLRLIFAAGGVTDFYSQKNSVRDRVAELSDIKKENMQLVREIERMRSDTGFQKKLVRDNLGFIAADEFLVLFPK